MYPFGWPIYVCFLVSFIGGKNKRHPWLKKSKANVGQLTDKSMLTAPTHALNVPGRWGKANWRKLDIVGRYCIAQEGGRFCIVAALNSPWQSKIAFGRIVPRYCWYVCSRGGWWGIQRWAEFSDTRLTDSYAPPSLLSTKSIFQYCQIQMLSSWMAFAIEECPPPTLDWWYVPGNNLCCVERKVSVLFAARPWHLFVIGETRRKKSRDSAGEEIDWGSFQTFSQTFSYFWNLWCKFYQNCLGCSYDMKWEKRKRTLSDK